MADSSWWLTADQCGHSDAELRRLGHALRKDERRAEKASLLNHIRSIDVDSRYVQRLLPKFQLAADCVFANLRCGAWYVQPPCGSVYFKSTDGHYGKWAFSLRRLNLHLAFAAVRGCGAAVVDATRSGKLYPDALSKTVPIWCCVVSRALALLCGSEPPELHLPSWVPPSERSAIETGNGCGGIHEWTQQLLLTSRATLLRLSQLQSSPVVFRPVWACPGDCSAQRAFASATSDGCVPILCISCSSTEPPPSISWTFIQGAGDDEEHWAAADDSCPLTHWIWWRHREQLLQCVDDDDAASALRSIATRDNAQDDTHAGVRRVCDGMVIICIAPTVMHHPELQDVTCAINITGSWSGWEEVLRASHIMHLHAHIPSPKQNKACVKVALLSRLPAITSFVSASISDCHSHRAAPALPPRPCIAILCDGPGACAAIAVAAALPLVVPVLDIWGVREGSTSAVSKGDVRRILANVRRVIFQFYFFYCWHHAKRPTRFSGSGRSILASATTAALETAHNILHDGAYSPHMLPRQAPTPQYSSPPFPPDFTYSRFSSCKLESNAGKRTRRDRVRLHQNYCSNSFNLSLKIGLRALAPSWFSFPIDKPVCAHCSHRR
jgi:tRNA A64-2'-O-ribosylphosphate transferase